MADYSGYYSCPECGKTGTYSKPADHKDTCSVPGKIAQSLRERAIREEAQQVHRAEVRAEWDELGDEELLRDLRKFKTGCDYIREQLRAHEEVLELGLDIMKQRDLVARWLDWK